MSSPIKQLWITDSWKSLRHSLDTSLRLMEEGLKLGGEVWWCDYNSICSKDGLVLAEVKRLRTVREGRKSEAFEFEASSVSEPHTFDQIHYRVDPPVNSRYLQPIQLLHLSCERGPRRQTPVEFVNPLNLLTIQSEKLISYYLPNFRPKNEWVTCRKDEAAEFLRKFPGAVIKPLDNGGSRGIQRMFHEAELDTLSWTYDAPYVLLQEYLPGIDQGEVRMWWLDGELIGLLRKKPIPGDFRVLIDEGSVVETCELSTEQIPLRNEVSRLLKHLGIRLAAVDCVGSRILDFNFTSPGLIVQLESVTGVNQAQRIQQKLMALP